MVVDSVDFWAVLNSKPHYGQTAYIYQEIQKWTHNLSKIHDRLDISARICQNLWKIWVFLPKLVKICVKYVRKPKYVKWVEKWAKYVKNIFQIFT